MVEPETLGDRRRHSLLESRYRGEEYLFFDGNVTEQARPELLVGNRVDPPRPGRCPRKKILKAIVIG